MMTKTPDELIHQWNADGRRYIRQLNALIADDREGRKTPKAKAWPKEPRKLEAAEAIMTLAETTDREGRWRRDCPIADRAHEPFVDLLDNVCQNLNSVIILGPDEFLVRPGTTAFLPGPTLHLRGGGVRELPGILGMATSRSHDLLLLAREDGFSVSRGLELPPIRHFPWPDGTLPTSVDCLRLSDDGLTIAFVLDKVWLGQAGDVAPVWTQVHPSDALLAEIAGGFSDAMMHCALSPDGRFIAYGSQSYGHFIDRIEGVAAVRRWAKIGYRSEYPHYAWFSDDGASAALNSCHFYNGATLGVRLSEIENVSTEPWEEDEHTTLLDHVLRVYAAVWLPLGPEKDGFALAGMSYLNIVSSDGTLRSSTHFGSSASSIDYCPKTGIVALGSYAGFLHVYDPNRQAESDQQIGYRPIHEVYRWVLWKDRAPFRW